MTRVVVIGRNYTSRLGMIRAVGKAGYNVTVIKTNRGRGKDIDAYSKYVDCYLYAFEPDRHLLIETIMSLKPSKNDNVILIPVDDYAASTIDDNLDILKEHFLFPNIGMRQGEITRMMDKDAQKKLACKVGLKVAKGWVIEIKNHKYTIPSDIQYPCFPKPQISFMGNKRCMCKCSTESELRCVIDEVAAQANCPILVEQFFNIDKEYATLGFSDGENIILPAMIRMLQDGCGSHKGVTLLGEILPFDEFDDFFNSLKEFIRSIGFVGLFDIDSFESNGQLYFNELNLRFGASGYAITNMEINLPNLFVNTLLGNENKFSDISIANRAVFVNEKVVYDDYVAGYITSKDCQNYIQTSSFGFIQMKDDPMPFRIFQFQQKKREVKNLIKKLIRWKKLKL